VARQLVSVVYGGGRGVLADRGGGGAAAAGEGDVADLAGGGGVVGWIDETPLPPGSRLDVRAYTTVLHALSRAGQYERALELFAELRRQGYEIKRDSMFHKAR
jgi:pentatricopeptide repeat protein